MASFQEIPGINIKTVFQMKTKRYNIRRENLITRVHLSNKSTGRVYANFKVFSQVGVKFLSNVMQHRNFGKILNIVESLSKL